MRFFATALFLLITNAALAGEPVNLAALDPQFKQCDYNHYAQCFQAPGMNVEENRAFLSKPYILAHPNQTEYVAVLAHGLTDSPFYFKDVARILYEHGVNVIAIRLAGHGTNPEDLKKIDLKDWRNDIAFGMNQAKLLGNKILLGGFSTGGALAIDRAVTTHDVAGLLLFSPAISIANDGAYKSLIPLATWFQPWAYPPFRIEDIPIRYRNMASNAVAQLMKLTIANWGAALSIDIPTFMAFTYRDKMIKPESLQDFGADLKNPDINTVVAFLTANRKNPPQGAPANFCYVKTRKSISHSYVPLQSNEFIPVEFNPCFDAMEFALSHHLLSNFGLTSCRSLLVPQSIILPRGA